MPTALLVFAIGCRSAPGRVAPPAIDADDAATAAIDALDKNGDAQLAGEELAGSPALASAKERYDANGDGSLSADEIAAGVRRWSEGQMGLVSVPFVVQLDGRPLEGADVRLVPEPFLGAAAKGAITETRRGASNLTLAPADRPAGAPNIPLVQPGLYRVFITHPTAKIPSQYNAATTLGIEIAQDTITTSGVTWSLKSR